MKGKTHAEMLAATLMLAAACLTGAYSAQKKEPASAKADVDFTRMNATMFMTQTYFPPVRSRITVSGRLRMVKTEMQKETFTIPRLVNADIAENR